MDWMGSVIYALVLLAVGVVVGGILSVWFWAKVLSRPEHARKMLKAMYRNAHPHWLQRGGPGGPRVCPCCGWSETEGIGVPVETGTVDAPRSPTRPIH